MKVYKILAAAFVLMGVINANGEGWYGTADASTVGQANGTSYTTFTAHGLTAFLGGIDHWYGTGAFTVSYTWDGNTYVADNNGWPPSVSVGPEGIIFRHTHGGYVVAGGSFADQPPATPSPTPGPSPTATPEVTPPPETPTPTPAPPSPTPTPTPEATPEPTPAPTPEGTPPPSPSPSPGPSPSPSPTPFDPHGGTPRPPIGGVTVGSGGVVVDTPIEVRDVDGKTYYTYPNADGGTTTIIFQGNGSTTVTTTDIRDQTALNSKENEAILAELKKHTDLLTDIKNSGTAAASPFPTVTPRSVEEEAGAALPATNPNEATGDEVTGMVDELAASAAEVVGGLKAGAGRASMPAVGAGYGSTLAWSISLPVLGTARVDLSPYSSVINAFRDFMKFLLALMAWIVSVKILRGTFV